MATLSSSTCCCKRTSTEPFSRSGTSPSSAVTSSTRCRTIDLPAPSGTATTPALVYATQLPNVTSIDFVGNFGASSYNSFQASVERRLAHGLTANINYTYSHNLDDVFQIFDGDGSVTMAGFGLVPSQISKNDYGNSPIDLKSRIAGFFSYDLPFGKSGSGFYQKVAGGFRFNGIGFWQTGNAIYRYYLLSWGRIAWRPATCLL